MEIKFKRNENILAALISGEIDHHSASSVREEIDGMIKVSRPKFLILDYDGISFMDSSGVGIAIGRSNKMKEIGGSTYIVANEISIARILRMSGVFELIKKTDSINTAVANITGKTSGGDYFGRE